MISHLPAECLPPLSSGQILVIPEVLDNAISSTVPFLMPYLIMYLPLSSQLDCNLHVARFWLTYLVYVQYRIFTSN